MHQRVEALLLHSEVNVVCYKGARENCRRICLLVCSFVFLASATYWRKDGYQEAALYSVLVCLESFIFKFPQALCGNSYQIFGCYL